MRFLRSLSRFDGCFDGRQITMPRQTCRQDSVQAPLASQRPSASLCSQEKQSRALGRDLMRTFVTAAAMALACAIVSASAIEGMDWAYPIAPKGKGKGPDTEKMLTVPGSKKQYTAAQIGDGFGPPDWFPDEHPTMPAVVANGRKEAGVRACALCHLPSGGGHPESANMAGLNPDYM